MPTNMIMNEMDAILNLVPVPVIGISDGVIEYINDSAKNSFVEIDLGYPAAALLGRRWEDYLQVMGDEPVVLTFDYSGEEYSLTIKKLREGLDILVFNPTMKTQQFSSEMINSISDKIRGQLTTIFSVTGLLFPKLEELEDEKIARQMAILNKSYYRLLRLSANIADADRLINGSTSLFLENVSITGLLRSFVGRLEPLCRTMGVALELVCPKKEVVIAVDRQKLERVMLNLLSNSLKSCQQEDKITIGLKVSDSNIYIKFSDTGKSIEPEKLPTVFNQYGGGTPEPGPDGLGLGMIIVRSVVALHGGSVALGSAKGKGTNVTISLPNRTVETQDAFRTRVVNYDYTGGLSHDLVELSDVLPPEVFISENVN